MYQVFLIIFDALTYLNYVTFNTYIKVLNNVVFFVKLFIPLPILNP